MARRKKTKKTVAHSDEDDSGSENETTAAPSVPVAATAEEQVPTPAAPATAPVAAAPAAAPAAAADDGDDDGEETGPVVIVKLAPIVVNYCPHCTFPAEMCEFSGVLEKCKPWLEEVMEQEAAAALEERGRKQKGIGEDAAHGPRPGRKAVDMRVTLQLKPRMKGKYLTLVGGLNNYGVDIKLAAHQFKKRFSCGTSVTESPGQPTIIEIQGDVIAQLQEMLPKDPFNICEANIVVLDPAKK